ncbi:MAG: response regulator, partial [Deltaproteobacteria bacterium]|nr:response regulator [Deltaproteobacteria bacterium]
MKKILIVDDSSFFIEIEKAFLQRTDCIILSAHNGQEALEVAQKEKPDLVLLDLYMKEMKGDECCRLIKEDEAIAHIPVIMVTSASHLGDRSRAVAAGCDDYLAKPVSKADLLRKVKKY